MAFSKALRWSFVLLVGATAVILLLILSGAHDPKPHGTLVVERPLFSQIVAPEAPRITWLGEPIPNCRFSVRLTVAQEAGNTNRGMDVGYGLALGDDDAHLAVAVSPLGYLSVWQETDEKTNVIFPWQTWPHVHQDLETNEIWLDSEDNGRLTIRINRELLWAGEIEPISGQIGVIAESLGETAIVDFHKLEVFVEKTK